MGSFYSYNRVHLHISIILPHAVFAFGYLWFSFSYKCEWSWSDRIKSFTMNFPDPSADLLRLPPICSKCHNPPTSLTSSCKSWFRAHFTFAWLAPRELHTHCYVSFLVAVHVGYRAQHWQQMSAGPGKINLPTTMPSAEAKYWLNNL